MRDKTKTNKKRVREIQRGLKKIKVDPETLQLAREIHKEVSRIPVEKLFRQFSI